jgi:hypothetical protein
MNFKSLVTGAKSRLDETLGALTVPPGGFPDKTYGTLGKTLAVENYSIVSIEAISSTTQAGAAGMLEGIRAASEMLHLDPVKHAGIIGGALNVGLAMLDKNAMTRLGSEVKLFGGDVETGVGTFEGYDLSSSFEGYDQSDLKNASTYSILSTLASGIEDSVSAKVLPIVMHDLTTSGIVVEKRMLFILSEYIRQSNGVTTLNPNKQSSLTKHLWDASIFASNTNENVVAAANPENDSLILKDLQTVKNGIATAPVKIGTQFDLIGISKVPNGQAYDDTDVLGPYISIGALYLKNTAGEYFKADLSASNVSYSPAQSQMTDSKDMALLKTMSITLPIGKLWNGTESSVATTIPGAAGYKVVFETTITGNTNLNHPKTKIDVLSPTVTINKIVMSNGETVPVTNDPNSMYQKILTALAGLAIVGVDPISFRTNTNLRTTGVGITSNLKKAGFYISPLSGVFAKIPTVTGTGTDGDTLAIADLLEGMNIKKRLMTIERLANFHQAMENNMGVDPVELGMLAGFDLNVYGKTHTVDADSIIDAPQSTGRVNDIQAALKSWLKPIVLGMLTDSNYLQVKQAIAGSIEAAKIKLTLVCGTTLYTALVGDGNDPAFSLIAGLVDIEPVLSLAPEIEPSGGYLVIQPNLDGTIDTAGYGNRVVRPTITAQTKRYVGTSSSDVVNSIPSIRDINWIPISVRLKITNLEQAIAAKNIYKTKAMP